jgi:hypothetical protein
MKRTISQSNGQHNGQEARGEAPERPAWLRPAQAAALLGVHPKTVGRYADEGIVRCMLTLRGHRRYWRDDIIAAREDAQEGGPDA